MQGFPFDSQLTFDSDNLPVYDRAVSSQPLRKLIRDLFTTGVMPNPSTNLQVSSGTDGMTVQVQAGFAVVDGGLCQETETRTLEVTAADTTYDRIDTVVLRWNENVDARTADLYVVAGTPSATPVRPTLQRDNSIYEIGLADIFITKRVATITDDKITDTRYEDERCGIVSSVSEWDTTTIYQQIQAELAGFKANEEADFTTWFDSMKDQLSEDAAGHLEQSKANLDGGNTFTGGNQTVQGQNINLKSTNLSRGETIESSTWGDSRLNIVDGNGNRCAFIQPLQRATGEVDLRIEKDSNNSGGKILINGIDIEQINADLTALYEPDIEFTVTSATTHNGLASILHNMMDLSKITERSIIQVGQLIFHVSQTTAGMYTKVLTSGSYIRISEFILSSDTCNLHTINITSSTSATFSAATDGTAVSVGTVVKVWY